MYGVEDEGCRTENERCLHYIYRDTMCKLGLSGNSRILKAF